MRSRGCIAIGLAWLLGGCGDDGAPSADASTGASTSSESTGSSTTIDPSTSSTSTSSESGSESEPSSSSTGPSCEAGEEGCSCRDDFTCGDGLACELNTCVACEAGTFACPCIPGDDEPGTCEAGLFCVAGLCATAPPCPWRNNGQCDEPRGTGLCLEGMDPEDCAEGTGTESGSSSDSSSGSDSGSDSDSGGVTIATTESA